MPNGRGGSNVFSNHINFQMPRPNRGGEPLYFLTSPLANKEQIVPILETVCFNLRSEYDYKSITDNVDILIPISWAFYCFSILQCDDKSPALSLPNPVANESFWRLSNKNYLPLWFDAKANSLLFTLLRCRSAIQIRQVTFLKIYLSIPLHTAINYLHKFYYNPILIN